MHLLKIVVLKFYIKLGILHIFYRGLKFLEVDIIGVVLFFFKIE